MPTLLPSLRSRLLSCPAILGMVLAALAIPAAASHKFVSFDVPGAVLTYATAINASGGVAGTYLGPDSLYHGFIRDANGTITTFDVSNGTLSMSVVGINSSGQIAGYYYDDGTFTFIREVDGTITLVAVPYAGASDTSITGINDSGEVCGWYSIGSPFVVDHGFVRNSSGEFTNLLASSVTQAINDSGETAGTIDATRLDYGFIEDQHGKTTEFLPSGATTTFPMSINKSGQIAGNFLDSSGIEYGFLRDSNGTITTFSGPGAGTGTFDGTYALALNDGGQVVGYMILNSGAYQAFVRDTAGAITAFNAPKAGTAGYTGTQAISINASGTITGYYYDASGVAHGFLRF